MSRNARIQKRQAATRKQKGRQEPKTDLSAHFIRIPIGEVVGLMMPDLREMREQAKTNPTTQNENAVPLMQLAPTKGKNEAAPPSIQNQAQLADKWAYEVRTQLSAILRRVGGSDVLQSIAVPEPAEMAPGLRGTLDSTTRSLSQSLDLLSTLRCMVG